MRRNSAEAGPEAGPSSRRDTGHGILKRSTMADRGTVEVPVLAPHLRFFKVGPGQTLLISENFHTLIRGQVHLDLLPLLDGRRREDVAAALAGRYAAANVISALAALTARGYVVSGDHDMDRDRAAFWSSLGASPRWAEQRMRNSQVAVTGDGNRLAKRLVDMGVTVGAEGQTLLVNVCDDYLDRRHADLKRRHVASGAPWMLLAPRGEQPLVGPVFRPAERGPCWACLAHRLRGHREIQEFLRDVSRNDNALLPSASEPVVVDAVYGLAAAEIARWLVFDSLAPLHANVISLDVPGLRRERHLLARRPQCRICGDEALYRPDRPPSPVRLRPSPKQVRSSSGGVRSVPPEATLARYRHLISPVTGVVTRLERATAETDPWWHVYQARGTIAPRTINDLGALIWRLQRTSSGKGGTAPQSEASALCEAIERSSGVLHGDEIRCRRRFSDFLAAGESEAIHPNDVQLFSERQLDERDQHNTTGNLLNLVPERLDPDAEIDWSPVWSLTQGRHRYLPTSLVYFERAQDPASPIPGYQFHADSNGCAAGNTLEEAILQGFFELVERDAFAIWWYNRLRLPGVDLGSFGDDFLSTATDHYCGRNRNLWVLDVTSDLGIPVFVALSRRIDCPRADHDEILYGMGAHTDPHVAVLRAVCELNQALHSHDHINWKFDGRWWPWDRQVRLEDSPWLMPAPGAALRRRSDHAVPNTTDTREDVEHCRTLVEARGLELLVLDQTRPDIGMPVAQVIVPGLRHFWRRFAPGRLFDVPVEMGQRTAPLAESELNDLPVTI